MNFRRKWMGSAKGPVELSVDKEVFFSLKIGVMTGKTSFHWSQTTAMRYDTIRYDKDTYQRRHSV